MTKTNKKILQKIAQLATTALLSVSLVLPTSSAFVYAEGSEPDIPEIQETTIAEADAENTVAEAIEIGENKENTLNEDVENSKNTLSEDATDSDNTLNRESSEIKGQSDENITENIEVFTITVENSLPNLNEMSQEELASYLETVERDELVAALNLLTSEEDEAFRGNMNAENKKKFDEILLGNSALVLPESPKLNEMTQEELAAFFETADLFDLLQALTSMTQEEESEFQTNMSEENRAKYNEILGIEELPTPPSPPEDLVEQPEETQTYALFPVSFSKLDVEGNELSGASLTILDNQEKGTQAIYLRSIDTNSNTDIGGRIKISSVDGKFEQTYSLDGFETYEIELPYGDYAITDWYAPTGYFMGTHTPQKFHVSPNLGILTQYGQNNDTLTIGHSQSGIIIDFPQTGGNETDTGDEGEESLDVSSLNIGDTTSSVNYVEQAYTKDNVTLNGTTTTTLENDYTWDSGTTGDQKLLTSGIYTLRELTAPNEWYALATDIQFEVDDAGNVFVDGVLQENGVIKMTDMNAGKLTVQKLVTGNIGSRTDTFKIEINIDDTVSHNVGVYDIDGREISTKTTANGGGIVIELSDSQYAVIDNLAKGTIYSIVEDLNGNEQYSYTIIDDNKGSLVEFDQKVTVLNEASMTPPTGVRTNRIMFLLLTTIMTGGIVLLIVRRVKER